MSLIISGLETYNVSFAKLVFEVKSVGLCKLFLSFFEIWYCDKMGYIVQQGLANASRLHSVALQSQLTSAPTHLHHLGPTNKNTKGSHISLSKNLTKAFPYWQSWDFTSFLVPIIVNFYINKNTRKPWHRENQCSRG